MITRVHAVTITLLLTLASVGLSPGFLAGEDEAVLAYAEIRDLAGRWSEVESLPGVAELLRSSAETLGWSEGEIPGSFAAREALVFRRVSGGHGVALSRVSSSEAAAAASARIDAAWDARLGKAPLVRGVVDLARVRVMLREWAAEEPFPLRSLVLELLATRLAPYSEAVFSRDIVDGELHFAAWIRHADSSAPATSLPDSAPDAAPPESGAPGTGIGLAQVPALVRFFAALDGLAVDVDAEEGGLLVVGRARFQGSNSDRP